MNYFSVCDGDLTGQVFGRLTVIKKTDQRVCRRVVWKCRCECGNECFVTTPCLKQGDTKSCGCLRKEVTSNLNIRSKRYKHGESRTRLYGCWRLMIQRCTNPSVDNYKHYGGRGISVCDEWFNSFESFRDWAKQNGYTDKLEIDRVDNEGNYCPDNCRFVTHKENLRNTRRNKILTVYGVRKVLAEWAREFGITREAIKRRLELGWSETDAVTHPSRTKAKARKGT